MARPIDNVSKRKKYRSKKFDGKKSTIDEYTGERIFSGNSRDAIYKHPTHKTTDDDHITPLDVIEKRYPNLTEEQRKTLANREYNLAETNSRLNRSKGKLENHQYLLRQKKDGKPENTKTTIKMLSKEVESRSKQRAESVVMGIDNQINNVNIFINNQTKEFLDLNYKKINNAGVSKALASAEFAAAFSVAKNAMSVIRDEKDGQDAAKEVLKDTVSAGVLGYATGAISEGAKLKGLNQDSTVLLVNGTIQITKQIYSYVNSDIDEKQLVQNIAETTAYLTAAYAGRIIGETVGMAVGGAIGAAVGQYVGEMITTAVCSTIIDTVHREQHAVQYNKKMLALAHRAEREIRESQGRLQLLVNKENERFIQQLDKGYDQFMQGVVECNYSMASSGLGMIAKEFNIEQDKLTQGHVTKGNIFGKKNRVIKM